MQKILLIILILLIGAGAYFLGKNQLASNKQFQTVYSSPTLGPTANWKTYTGQNFSLKYPNGWTSKISVADSKTTIIESGKRREELVIQKVTNKNYQELTNQVLSLFLPQPKIRQLNLGTGLATEYYGCAGVEGCLNQYILVVTNGQQLYEVSFATYLDEESGLYEKMLSTFKFTQ